MRDLFVVLTFLITEVLPWLCILQSYLTIRSYDWGQVVLNQGDKGSNLRKKVLQFTIRVEGCLHLKKMFMNILNIVYIFGEIHVLRSCYMSLHLEPYHCTVFIV